jgi:hypothetical protein
VFLAKQSRGNEAHGKAKDGFGYLHGSLEALSTDQGWRAIGFYGIAGEPNGY